MAMIGKEYSVAVRLDSGEVRMTAYPRMPRQQAEAKVRELNAQEIRNGRYFLVEDGEAVC